LSPSTYTGFLTSAKTIDKISLHLTVGFDDAGFAWSVVIKRAATARLPKKATYANVRFLRVIRGQMCDPRSWHWKQRSCGNVAFVPACPRYSMVFIMPMPPCDATPSYPPPPNHATTTTTITLIGCDHALLPLQVMDILKQCAQSMLSLRTPVPVWEWDLSGERSSFYS